VHLLRDLVFLAEEQGAVWVADLKELLLDMKQATDQAREQAKLWLDPLEVVGWESRFLDLLDEGDQLHPLALAPPGQRGRCKQSAARNLLNRLRKHQHSSGPGQLPNFICPGAEILVESRHTLT